MGCFCALPAYPHRRILFSAKDLSSIYFAAHLLHVSVDGRGSVNVRIEQTARLSELSASPHILRSRHQRLPLFSRIRSTFAGSSLPFCDTRNLNRDLRFKAYPT